MGGTERGQVKEGLSEKVALGAALERMGVSGRVNSKQMTSPDTGRSSVGVLSGAGEGWMGKQQGGQWPDLRPTWSCYRI